MNDPSALKIIDNRMSRLTALKIIAKRMNRLTTASAVVTNPKHATRFAEELDQLAMISDELKKLDAKTTAKTMPDREALRREMEALARKLAAMRWDDPERHDIVNEFTRLAMMADSIDRFER